VEQARLEKLIDRLYSLPLDEFVDARNALAAALKSDGDRDQAEHVRRLTKPLATAWVVNRLFRTHRRVFDRLLASGESLRSIQGGSAPAGGGLRRASERRGQATQVLRAAAVEILRDSGQSATPATMRRIETTLDAIAILGDAGPDNTLGRLTRDLDPPGFEGLFALGAVPAATPGTKKPARKTAAEQPSKSSRAESAYRRRLELARAAVDRAEKEAVRRRDEVARACAAHEAAEARLSQANADEEEVALRLERCRKKTQQAEKEVRRAEALAKRAATALDRAERTAAENRAALDET
jgi:hypothetical protein